ncbi:hypothetical protein [Actinobacillus porcinus]|uniref:hypothetical protein n=1 Tax=Actinobacillus porcinus TaxID=51048 RepID=UPI002A919629|nr:hypothetical protein [Actinobacillus porcinus]MDY6216763.1 hypothetical protein [Actinobacillus porcinus]
MKKALVLLLGIASLSFSTNLLANDKDFYAGWEELKVLPPTKDGFANDNDGAELLYKHIMFYTDNTCTKKLDVKYDEVYTERKKIPYRLVYTYKYQGKEKLRVETNLCIK